MTNSITLAAEEIAACCLYGPSAVNFKTQLDQTVYRIELIAPWGIKSGERILEIGCGQGDATTILATAVGETGHVTAVDPAPLDYGERGLYCGDSLVLIYKRTVGSPYTLGQAQAHISAGPLGSRITWVQSDPLSHLASLPAPSPDQPKPYDLIVFVQSSWYFSSPASLAETIAALTPYAKRLGIAEYSLHTNQMLATPHVLAVLTEAALEVHKPVSSSNVRTVVSPRVLKEMVKESGWELEKEFIVVPKEGQHEGTWETSTVVSQGYLKQIEEALREKERERIMILALRDATIVSTEQAGGTRNVRTMDVWSAMFVLSK